MPRMSKDDLLPWLEQGLHESGRMLELAGELTQAEAQKVIKILIHLNAVSASPIRLLINCEGGDLVGGLAITDCITSLRCYVTGIVIGECSSVATVILQSCDERVIGETSNIMFHPGTTGLGETPVVESEQAWELNKKQIRMADDIVFRALTKKTGISRKKFDAENSKGTSKVGHDAVKYGLADRLLSPKDLL